jgi:hypothetical protein
MQGHLGLQHVGRIGAEGVIRRFEEMAGYGFASNPPYEFWSAGGLRRRRRSAAFWFQVFSA